MNKSVMLIMGGALIVAIIVAMIVQAKLTPKAQDNTAPTSQILVASKDLALGAKLQPTDVTWHDWPENAVYAGVITKAEQPDLAKLDVYEAPLRRAVKKGEPLTRQMMIADVKGSNNFLAASITPGMRAMAISVSADSTAGGFVSPGDHVDIILAYTPEMQGDTGEYAGEILQRYASETILSNVKVMAVDQVSSDEAREAKLAKTVTVELTKEGAETLAMARQMGTISLALRRIGDQDEPASVVHPLVTDTSASNVLRAVQAAKKKAKTQTNVIRMYTGSDIQNVPVRALPQAGGQP